MNCWLYFIVLFFARKYSQKNARAGDTKPLYSLKNAPPCFWGLLVKVAQNAFVLARPLSSHIYMGLIWSGLRLAAF